MKTRAFIGIDAGGTKTLGVAIDEYGHVLGHKISSAANYQAVGVARAKKVIREIMDVLTSTVAAADARVAACAYGMSGLDRPVDEERIRGFLNDVHPGGTMVLVNDTFLILRAGTHDGVGVAVVSGTGSNTVGRSATGRTFRIGGFCFEMGDAGSGWDIAVAALRAAKRGSDGRGQATVILDLLMEEFGLQHIDDAMDFLLSDQDPGPFYHRLTPLVFRAARQGDLVARGILTDAGVELGRSAALVAARLFGREDEFNCVLGGSVFLAPDFSLMRKALELELHRSFPRAKVVRIPCQPVCGALLLAADEVLEPPKVRELQLVLTRTGNLG